MMSPNPPIPPPYNPSGPVQMSPSEERNWAVAIHLSSFSGYLGIPFGHILGPLILWLIKKDGSHFLDEVGKETVNYNISIILWFIVCIPFMFILIGFFMFGALALMDIIVTIVAAVAASNGQQYRYPLTIRFIS
jgi:hypothetical protein